MTTASIHHLYLHRQDLLPACGVTPGPGDPRLGEQGNWHTGHVATVLLVYKMRGYGCCGVCLSLAQEQLATTG